VGIRRWEVGNMRAMAPFVLIFGFGVRMSKLTLCSPSNGYARKRVFLLICRDAARCVLTRNITEKDATSRVPTIAI